MKATHIEDFGETLIQDFLKVFDEFSMNNELYGRLILHVVLGQALKNICFRVGARRIDIRIHGLLIKPSGTGKGAGYGFYVHLSEDLNLRNELLTESTDAGLVGSAQVNPQTREPELLPGLLVDADLISMEEASVLFDFQNDFSKKNLTYLQIAMNPLEDKSCHISKRIGMLQHSIEIDPHCSFLLTTYIPDKFVDSLIKRGIIQRFLCVIERVPVEERKQVVDDAIEKIGKISLHKTDDDYTSVLSRLKIVINRYNKLGIIDETRNLTKEQKDKVRLEAEFNLTEDARAALIQSTNKFTEMIKDTTILAQEKLEEFTHRNFEILMRLSIHHAILSMRSTIEPEDVVYANTFFEKVWKALIYNIEELLVPSQIEKTKFRQTISYAVAVYNKLLAEKKHVMKGGFVNRKEMIDLLQVKWDNCSMITASKRLRRIETFEAKETNKTKWFLTKQVGHNLYDKLLREE